MRDVLIRGLVILLVLVGGLAAVSAFEDFSSLTLQSAATATGVGTAMPVDRFTTASAQVTISNTATVTFQGTVDGSTWASLVCTALGSSVGTSATATATGLYQCNVAGLAFFRANITAYTSGTVTVKARATTANLGGGGVLGFLFDAVGNLKVTIATLLSGEDQTNSLIRTSGGAVRQTSLGSMTSATSSTPAALFVGDKTFYAQIVNATSETKAATLTIYGSPFNNTTYGKAICTITLPSTATTLALQDVCPTTKINYSYYWYTTTVYTSASSAPLTVYAMY